MNAPTAASSPFAFEPGTVVAGKYRVVRALASGGMGAVLLVKHDVLGQHAAIKLLRPEAARSPDATERFLREARAAANLRSDHVARVFDVGSLDDGTPYMLMEYLEGRDLAAELEHRVRLPVSEAVEYVLQAIEAVAEAHEIGVIHRDLKPSNLFLVDKPGGARTVKVLDFGISKVVSGVGAIADGAVTEQNALLGSPAYMSPEQVKSSRDVDARTDVWSLGVVLHELVTGCRAFDAETMGALLSQILTDDVRPPSHLARDIPPGFDEVIARCLSRDREGRFPSVAALRDALLPFGAERPRISIAGATTGDRTSASVVPARTGVETTVAVSSSQGGATPPSVAAAPPRRSLFMPIAAVGSLLLIAAIVLAARSGSSSAPSSPAAAPPAPSVTASAAPVVIPAEPLAFASAASSAAPPASASAPAPAACAQSSASSAPRRRPPPPPQRAPIIDLNQRN